MKELGELESMDTPLARRRGPVSTCSDNALDRLRSVPTGTTTELQLRWLAEFGNEFGKRSELGLEVQHAGIPDLFVKVSFECAIQHQA